MNIKIIIACLCAFIAPLSMAHVKISYGVSEHQNRRPYQEDRFAVYKRKFFGVYDGHGGDKTSSFLQKKLHIYFAQAQGNVEEKFKRAFEEADYVSQNSWQDGSTAVVIYIDKNNVLHCAWAGDSRAVVEGNGKVALATNDHKPDREDEKKRIEKAGGNVVMHGVWRVNGLAVSRSIGDIACKLQGIGQIIATPEYAHMQLTKDNHFAIIASDGLWDVMTNEEAVTVLNMIENEWRNKEPLGVLDQLSQDLWRDKKSLDNIAYVLRTIAINRGSGDNITICVIQFDWTPQSAIKKWWNWLWGK
jgi:protein phosphatase 1L